MGRTGWWSVAMAATLVLVTALVALSGWAGPWRLAGAFMVIGLLAIAYGTIGWRAVSNPALALPFQVIVIGGTIVGAAFIPNLATMQCIAFPIVWSFGGSTRRSILMSVGLAAGVAGGIFLSTGATPDALVQAIAIQTVSLALGIGLGLWLTVEFRASGENARLLAELRSTQSALADANREAGITSERERLAREIHDTIAQSLTSLVMLAQRGQAEAGTLSVSPADRDRMTDHLGLMEDIARDALTETRAVVAASAPVSVAGGVTDAITRLVARFTRETGLTITTELSALDGLDRQTEVVLLRCTQEALANVRKHARASTVVIAAAGDGTRVTLRVRDDGVGFDVGSELGSGSDRSSDGTGTGTEQGFGLDGMRDRVALAGGVITLRSVQGAEGEPRGTELEVIVPLAHDSEQVGPAT